MTFLLQKFNAINRTRTEARARNGLRPTAGGIAFTGRLAVVCLLLAGFLGVGSAIAQPKVLRVGGGPITVDLEMEFPGAAVTGVTGGGENAATDWGVHHYQIGTMDAFDLTVDNDLADTPNPSAQTASFLVGRHALVSISEGMLTITPIATGAFKIAVDPDYDAVTDDFDDEDEADFTDDDLRPVFVKIMSVNSPQVRGKDNAGVEKAANTVAMQLRDKALVVPDQFKDLNTVFTDQNDVFLTYRASADKVGGMTGMRRPVAKDGEAILSVSTAGAKLTISLTTKAKDGDMTDVWVWATDGAGEYARWQVPVSVGAGSAPYVESKKAPVDMVLREDALVNTNIDFTGVFTAGKAPAPENPTGVGGTLDAYKIETSDVSAAKVGVAPDVTYIVPAMVATVSGMGTKLDIRPRAPGVITFIATATDKGEMCKLLDTSTDPDTVAETPKAEVTETSARAGVAAYCYTELGAPPNSSDQNHMGYVPVDGVDDPRSPEVKAADAKEVASRRAQFRFAQSASHSFTVTVVTKTSPMADKAIPNRTEEPGGDKDLLDDALVGDGDAVMFDLEDLNGAGAGEPVAFADPTKEGLTYTVTAKDPIAVITVEGSMVTLAPIWRSGPKTTDVTVTATNNLDEVGVPEKFKLTVESATLPVVNSHVAVQAVLATGIMLKTGDAPLVVNLTNLTNEEDEDDYVPLFIDPNAATGDALPGGLLYKMQVKDVVAHLVYVNQSKENDVSTSAMRLVLDPAAATLTVTPTAASFATVTVWGIDRERNMISATTTITVVSCDGVDMSDPCDGVTVGTEGEELPTEVELSQNYPNPFNPQTTIDYALPKASDVSLVVYDMLGREVDVLLDGPQAAGRHTVRFGANHLPNGTYVYRLVAADKTITRTMVLVK